jgi:hypothetical protein
MPLSSSGLCFSFLRDFAFICGVVLGAVNDLLRPSAVPFLTFNNAPSAGYRETQTDLLATDSRLESVTPDRRNRQKSIQMDGNSVYQDLRITSGLPVIQPAIAAPVPVLSVIACSRQLQNANVTERESHRHSGRAGVLYPTAFSRRTRYCLRKTPRCFPRTIGADQCWPDWHGPSVRPQSKSLLACRFGVSLRRRSGALGRFAGL